MASHIVMALNTPSRSALRPEPAATTASADFSLRVSTSPFQVQGEISPGKNALLHCTTAGFTPLRLDHESFVVHCPLALLGSAFYPVLPPQGGTEVSIGSQFMLHASSPRSVALTQLRFTSFAVINLRRDLHPQECAHAGRTNKKAAKKAAFRDRKSELTLGELLATTRLVDLHFLRGGHCILRVN